MTCPPDWKFAVWEAKQNDDEWNRINMEMNKIEKTLSVLEQELVHLSRKEGLPVHSCMFNNERATLDNYYDDLDILNQALAKCNAKWSKQNFDAAWGPDDVGRMCSFTCNVCKFSWECQIGQSVDGDIFHFGCGPCTERLSVSKNNILCNQCKVNYCPNGTCFKCKLKNVNRK